MKLNEIFEGVAERKISVNGFSISFIDDPSRLSSAVDDNEFVLDAFNDATASAFGAENRDEGHDGVREHVLNVRSIAVCYSESDILGFASIKHFEGLDVFYVHGIVTRSELQGSGVGYKMIKGLLTSIQKPRFISLTTQNPVVYYMIKQYCSSIFPSPEYSFIPKYIQDIGIKLMKHRQGEFDSTTFMSRNLYSRCLYGKGVPVSRDEELNQWFGKSLGVESGESNDGFLLIGELK